MIHANIPHKSPNSMIEPAKCNNVVSFLWAIADLLNGAFQKSEFQKIILPFTVLRRLDYALETNKNKVLDTERALKEKGLENRHRQLCRAAGYAFYNTSKFNYESLLHDDANLALNLRQYVMGFSLNVREIFAAFNFDDTIRDLGRVNLLYLLMERFNEKSKVDLRPASMSNHEMGYVFEHLLRKFNEALNENPGEHFTPREVIRLMVDLVLMFDTELASGEGVARTVNDCCCGTGGMLTLTKDRIQQINPPGQGLPLRAGQNGAAAAPFWSRAASPKGEAAGEAAETTQSPDLSHRPLRRASGQGWRVFHLRLASQPQHGRAPRHLGVRV